MRSSRVRPGRGPASRSRRQRLPALDLPLRCCFLVDPVLPLPLGEALLLDAGLGNPRRNRLPPASAPLHALPVDLRVLAPVLGLVGIGLVVGGARLVVVDAILVRPFSAHGSPGRCDSPNGALRPRGARPIGLCLPLPQKTSGFVPPGTTDGRDRPDPQVGSTTRIGRTHSRRRSDRSESDQKYDPNRRYAAGRLPGTAPWIGKPMPARSRNHRIACMSTMSSPPAPTRGAASLPPHPVKTACCPGVHQASPASRNAAPEMRST